jgi:NADH:ubiquinone oxidoreductase subunit E
VRYREIINDHVDKLGGLIEAFIVIQNEYGYLPEEAIREAARAFMIPASEAFGIASFYKMFDIKPAGEEKAAGATTPSKLQEASVERYGGL